MKVKIFVEGADMESAAAQTKCRKALSRFFEKAGITKRPATIPCGGRDQAFKDFCREVKLGKNVALLLVDSEGPVDSEDSVWEHLKKRDDWNVPKGVGDDQGFMMVQVMETWFLADPDSLEQFFGQGFRNNVLKKWPDLEAVGKLQVYEALEKSTSDCKKSYRKGNLSFDLLEQIDPSKVEDASQHASNFLNRLRQF